MLLGFQQKILKIAFESLRNKLHEEFFNGSHRVSSLVRWFDKINHRLHFYCTIDRSSPLNCTVYSFFKSRILMQQPIAPLEGVSAHFSNMYCVILNERTGDIRSYWVDVTAAAGPILLRLGRETKLAVFWSYFRDLVGVQNIEDLSESFFFPRSISNDKWIKRKKKLGGGGGVRCTLTIVPYCLVSSRDSCQKLFLNAN